MIVRPPYSVPCEKDTEHVFFRGSVDYSFNSQSFQNSRATPWGGRLGDYTILYYTILYYTILYYTILYYTILHSTTLHNTTLYYTVG